jgi:aryl-alcohol dehydrogenase-like predicted oxidoreductase
MQEAFVIGGDLRVSRLGFGAMRITGPGVWGWPSDRGAAVALLRRAVELGINLVDTADAYGRSEVMLPIPGTSSIAHLEENARARELDLSDDDFAALDTASWSDPGR